MKKEQEVSEKLAAQTFAKCYVEALVPNVFHRLQEEGLFSSPARAGKLPFLVNSGFWYELVKFPKHFPSNLQGMSRKVTSTPLRLTPCTQ